MAVVRERQKINIHEMTVIDHDTVIDGFCPYCLKGLKAIHITKKGDIIFECLRCNIEFFTEE